MIGQKIGLQYLVPLAIEVLEDNIFAEGDFYVGDLLESVLKVDKEFWNNNSSLKCGLNEIIQKNIEFLTNKRDDFNNQFI